MVRYILSDVLWEAFFFETPSSLGNDCKAGVAIVRKRGVAVHYCIVFLLCFVKLFFRNAILLASWWNSVVCPKNNKLLFESQSPFSELL